MYNNDMMVDASLSAKAPSDGRSECRKGCPTSLSADSSASQYIAISSYPKLDMGAIPQPTLIRFRSMFVTNNSYKPDI